MTSSWHSLSLGDGMTAGELSEEIREAFLSAFRSAGESVDMAVFTRHESEGRLHCEVIAYFSPPISALAKRFGAGPCQSPERGGLSLLAGDEGTWAVWFPESES